MHFKTATIVALTASLGGNLFTSAAPVADVTIPKTLEIREILGDKTISLGKRDGGFLGSCRNVRLDGGAKTWLVAECRNLSGGWPTSRLNMNRCFVNSNGRLGYLQNGGYGGSCDVGGSFLSPSNELVINCPGYNGVWSGTLAYRINDHITNASGQLMCFGGST
ncbi:uncharacterized protein B0I36DRAFT_364305 [Microdochium trichocladiopsis]|uniref:Cyanovirin-N domain-containing protein n=1 Tax=Microdochium trichocladiopsis TaxID=1682393 RepID=A0A9P9BTG8_9PEZI|nr:uncharacterized protein B0I36DRAFT_364305 [Microdochium trichocladiopsis]KAH7029831.1 hypothetical protein B0I36DRAFT_364305 [Microdochium trichocladiopsis]